MDPIGEKIENILLLTFLHESTAYKSSSSIAVVLEF